MNTQENSITALALCEAFVENKAKAEREYSNRIMKISGTAIHVGPDLFGLPCVELSETKEGHSRAICLLPFNNYLRLRIVSKGDEVVMEGEVRSLYDKGKTVVVKHCQIVGTNGK